MRGVHLLRSVEVLFPLGGRGLNGDLRAIGLGEERVLLRRGRLLLLARRRVDLAVLRCGSVVVEDQRGRFDLLARRRVDLLVLRRVVDEERRGRGRGRRGGRG
jgi:hypothetical protein